MNWTSPTNPPLRKNSFADRLVNFFRSNPDEFLATSDLRAKFGRVANLHTALAKAVEVGYVVKSSAGNSLQFSYHPGPRLTNQGEETSCTST